MIRYLRLFFLFSLTLMSLVLPAQDTLTLQVKPVFRVRWKADPLPEEKISSQLIKEIAYDEVLGIGQTSISVEIPLHCKVFQEGDNDRIVVKTGKAVITGNTLIRGFNTAGKLVPSSFSLSLTRVRKSDSLVIQKLKWNALPLVTDSIIANVFLRRNNFATDTLIFRIEGVQYSERQFHDFLNHLQLINDYYACSAILDSLGLMLEKEKLMGCHDLPVTFLRIEEMGKALKLMQERNFQDQLSLENYDPGRFKLKFQELFRMSRTLAVTFQQKLDTVSFLSRDPGCDPARIMVDHFCRYIRWAMLVNSRNGKIYDDYIDSFYSLSVYDDDLAILKKLLSKMSPGEPVELVFQKFSDSVCRTFEDAGKQMIDHYMFPESARLMNIEAQFRQFTGDTTSTAAMQAIKIRATNGIYNAYLGVSVNSMDLNKYNLAEVYLGKAQQFRAQNPKFVTSDSLFHLVAGRLIDLKFAECDTLAARSRYDEAIACYQSMNINYDSLTNGVFKLEINHKSDYCYYRKFRDAGLYYLTYGNLTDAGKFLNLSNQIRIRQNFVSDTLLDSLSSATYPYYLISLLRSREELIWTDRLKEASAFADSVESAAKADHAAGHDQFHMMLARYRKKIWDKECYNASDAYEIYVLRGQRNYELKNYLRGNMLYDSALITARVHPACFLDTLHVVADLKKYSAPADFQRQQKNISNLVSINEYEKAVDLLFETNAFYREHQLDKYGISCPGFYDFISSRNLTGLTYECVIHCAGMSDYVKALQFLKLLRVQEYPKKDAAEVQKQVARALAQKDFSPGKDPVAQAASYVAADKWFTAFRMAYIYSWNEMKHKDSSEPEKAE